MSTALETAQQAFAEIDEFELGGVGGGILQKAERTLSPAEIRALHTTPIEVVPSPGIGKFLAFHSVTMRYSNNAEEGVNPYGDGNTLSLNYTGTSAGVAAIAKGILLFATDKIAHRQINDIAEYEFQDVTAMGKGFTIKSASAFTNNDATGTLKVITHYTIEDFN